MESWHEKSDDNCYVCLHGSWWLLLKYVINSLCRVFCENQNPSWWWCLLTQQQKKRQNHTHTPPPQFTPKSNPLVNLALPLSLARLPSIGSLGFFAFLSLYFSSRRKEYLASANLAYSLAFFVLKKKISRTEIRAKSFCFSSHTQT